MPINRGEIYFISLDPAIGMEIGGNKSRPAVVLSINDINRKPLTVTVVPGTKAGDKRTDYRNAALISPSPSNRLAFDTIFQGHQIRAVDHVRFVKGPIGCLSDREMTAVENAVRYSLGL